MNPIPLLTENVSSLWYWIYGIIAGWGVTLTVMVVVVIILIIRLLRCEQKLQTLKNRIIVAERDFNIATNKWQSIKKNYE